VRHLDDDIAKDTTFRIDPLGRKRCQCVLAGLLAPATPLGADTTVLVVTGVALTFIAASTTSFDTSLDDYAGELGHELGLPAEDISGRRADVAAVSTQRDTRNECLDIGLAEVGISASRAALGTVETRVDASSQNADFHSKRPRMCLEDLLSVGHGHSSRESLRSSRAPLIAHQCGGSLEVGVETPTSLFMDPAPPLGVGRSGIAGAERWDSNPRFSPVIRSREEPT
jgi:hypothetical protein